MKKLLLPLLFLFSCSSIHAETIEQSVKQLNNNRLASLIKAGGASFLGFIAAKEGASHLLGSFKREDYARDDANDYFFTALSRTLKNGGWNNVQATTTHGVKGFGLLYVSWSLFKYALNRANHAFNGVSA